MDYSNVGAMLSQLKGQAAYTDKGASTVTGKQMQAVEMLLKSMEPGQIFSGEITDIRGAYITITLQNMQSIHAKLAENFEFLIGQKALFQVKDNQDNQLLIRPLAMNAAQNGELMVAERALNAAGIQITEKTLELVKNLMSANQPIDKQSILSYVRQLAKFPQAEIPDLISLHKYQIPVNEENLNQLSNYRQFEHSLLNDIDTLQQKLPQVVAQLAAQSPEKAEAFMKSFTDILYSSETATETGAEVKGNLGGSELQNAGQEVTVQGQESAASSAEQRATTLVEKNSGLTDMLKELSQLTGKEWTEKAGTIIKKALEDNFLLKPEEVADKEKIKEYYKEVAAKGEGLKELFAAYREETAQLQKPVQNMTQNLKFMQSMNEMFTYIQLPLKMHNEQAHGDLYVYTKRKAKGNAEEGFSALLHLDMENLGAVDVLVRLKGQRVATNFTLETEELLDFIEQHMDRLTERLQKKGYDCSTQVALKNVEEEKKSFEQMLTGEAEAYSDIKRFSFDVRA